MSKIYKSKSSNGINYKIQEKDGEFTVHESQDVSNILKYNHNVRNSMADSDVKNKLRGDFVFAGRVPLEAFKRYELVYGVDLLDPHLSKEEKRKHMARFFEEYKAFKAIDARLW